MSRLAPPILAALSILVVSCTDPQDVPPPRFNPNAPNPPEQVDPPTTTPDPYGQNRDPIPPTPPEPETPAARPGEYPLARPTAKPGEVISPYEPYNVIDVTGFSSGQLARDPSNKKIFRVP